jgi:aspartyl-tRNA(Asn)/glutamyl-tRNA(Gln) amidotransferase subunit B
MVAAVEYEIKRQIEAQEKGEKLHQETRGWNEEKKQTYLQRSKEEAHDYRYFPEPDLPEMHLEESKVQNLKSKMPELPWEKVKRFIGEFGLKPSDAKILTESSELSQYFEQVVLLGKKEDIEPKAIANYIINSKIDLIDSSLQQIIDDLKAKKSNLIEGTEELEKLAKEAMADDSSAVANYKGGKLGAIMALVGLVMKKTQGKANAAKVKEILEELLK